MSNVTQEPDCIGAGPRTPAELAELVECHASDWSRSLESGGVTEDQLRDALYLIGSLAVAVKDVAKAIERVRQKERDACANLAEFGTTETGMGADRGYHADSWTGQTRKQVAEEIRARGV